MSNKVLDLAREYLAYNGKYAASMPAARWVERLAAAVASESAISPKFPVGTKFVRILPGGKPGKRPTRECTVTDFWVTRNLAGEVVRTGYVATHEFMGQQIDERDICETTIAKGLLK